MLLNFKLRAIYINGIVPSRINTASKINLDTPLMSPVANIRPCPKAISNAITTHSRNMDENVILSIVLTTLFLYFKKERLVHSN